MWSYRVPLSQIDTFRPLIEPKLSQLCLKPWCDWTVGKIIEDAKFDQILLWLALDGLAIRGVAATQVRLEDSPPTMELKFITGERWHMWAHLLEDLINHARARGCDRIIFEGRKGWARRLPDFDITGKAENGLNNYERRI